MRMNHIPSLKILLSCLAVCLFFSTISHAGDARCFMHGIITPTTENREKASLSDMIRMRFDAKEKAKCEQMMTSYCTHHIRNKDYSPARLKGSFKPDMDKSEEYIYTYTEKCKIVEE